jgi:hypothetical protein
VKVEGRMMNDEMAGKAAQSHTGAKAEGRMKNAERGPKPVTCVVHAWNKPG